LARKCREFAIRSYADVVSARRRYMSIDEQGFLSDDIMQCRDQIRQRYARYFDFIQRVNTFCQQVKFRIDGTSTNDQNLMASRLIIKLLADMQGAVLLVERGLASQARTSYGLPVRHASF
jgi:hypothetical protein